MENKEKIRIYSWRFAAVILPWFALASMFLIAHTNYLKMKETADEFPSFVEKVNEKVNIHTQEIGILKEAVLFLKENARQTNDKLDEINQNLIRLASKRESRIDPF